MIVEVRGIGFPNKGAELMLVALEERLSQEFENIIFAVEPTTDFQKRNSHGVFTKVRGKKLGLDIGYIVGLLPKRMRLRYGLITEKDIDIVLDASGFAYGDQWGPERAYNALASKIRRWKRNGKKVIILPQALGPFEDPLLANYMETIFESADLVFARDDISFDYATKLSKKIKQCPDFTNLVNGRLPLNFDSTEQDVCVIPNSKMIQMTDKSVGETYPRQVADIIEYCQTKGLRPYLLLHEGIRDLKLAEEINQMLSKEVMIYQYPDAKDIKGVISTARFVVSSRFHGIVSALSQGVPAIATGWSHKYQMLMEDYKCTQLLIDDDNSDVNAIIDLLADEESYGSIKSKIDAERILLKKKVSSMWDEVISLMKS